MELHDLTPSPTHAKWRPHKETNGKHDTVFYLSISVRTLRHCNLLHLGKIFWAQNYIQTPYFNVSMGWLHNWHNLWYQMGGKKTWYGINVNLISCAFQQHFPWKKYVYYWWPLNAWFRFHYIFVLHSWQYPSLQWTSQHCYQHFLYQKCLVRFPETNYEGFIETKQ